MNIENLQKASILSNDMVELKRFVYLLQKHNNATISVSTSQADYSIVRANNIDRVRDKVLDAINLAVKEIEQEVESL